MNLPILTAGFDPTVAPGTPTNSQLLQMVQAAHVATGIGIIYWGASAPSLVTYPDAETALWGKLDGSGDPTGEFFYWFDDGVTAAWTAFTITALDGSKITNGTITANKLSTAGASAGDILYFNGTSWTLAAIVASITDNTLPIAKLVKPTSGSKQVLYYNGSTLQWYNLTGADIIALFSTGSIPVAKLAVGGARYVLRTKSDLSTVEYVAPSGIFDDYELSVLALATDTSALTIASGVITLDAEVAEGPTYAVTLNTNITDFNVSNLASGREITVLITQDGTGGRTVAWDAAINWIGNSAIATAASAITAIKFVCVSNVVYGTIVGVKGDGTDYVTAAVPAAGSTATLNHGLGVIPSYWKLVLECTTTEHGVSVGEEVDPGSFFCYEALGTDDTIFPAFNIRATTAGIKVTRNATFTGSFGTIKASDGTVAASTPGNYQLKLYYRQ